MLELIIPDNTYVTLNEADEYLQYEIGASERWLSLSADERISYLVTAFRKIQTIRLLKHTPENIKKQAQMLEAFEWSDFEMRNTESRRARGLKSVSVGKASESYDNKPPVLSNTFLLSSRAYSLLGPWIERAAIIV